jgi:plastocyanin
MPCPSRHFALPIAICLTLCWSVVAQDTATLRLRVVVDGQVASPKQVSGINDAFCSEFPLMTDNLIVGSQGELKNLALILDEERTKVKIPDSMLKPPAATHVLDNTRCLFEPKVLVARPGQTINVKNSDNTGHNANFQFLKNPPTNFLIPAGQSKDLVLKPDLSEPTAIPIECNIHPWMKAFIIVKQHPYVGVSDQAGIIEIPDLPVGKGVVFRLWHESTRAIDQVEVGGKAEKLARGNRWELDLKPGVNDLGTVKLSAKLFTGN